MLKPVTLSLYYLNDNYEDFEVHCDNFDFDLDEAIEKTPNGVANMQRELKTNRYLPELGKRIKDTFDMLNRESKIEITSVSITSYSSCNIEFAIKSDLPEDKVKALITNIVKNDTFNLYVDFINPDDDEMESLELKFKFYEFN